MAGPQAQGGDGQNAAAAAQVQHPVPGLHVGLHPLQAQLGGGVGPGAEGEAGVHQQPGGPVGDGGGVPLPFGHDVEPFPDGQGAVVLLPAVGPVVLPEGDGGVGQVNAGQVGLQLGLAVGVVGDVELHPGDPLHLVQQGLVHIVPVLAVLLQEGPELLLFLHRQAGDAVGDEFGAEVVQVLCLGI